MDGWMDEWMDGWMDVCVYIYIYTYIICIYTHHVLIVRLVYKHTYSWRSRLAREWPFQTSKTPNDGVLPMEGVGFAACCMWYPQNSHRQCHRQSPRPKQLGELNVILRSYDKGQVGNLMQIRIQTKHIGLEWRDDSYHPQSSHNHNHPIIPWSFWRVCERRLAGPPRWWCNSAGIVKMNKPRRYNEGNYMELLYLTKLATHMCCPGGLIIQSWHCLLNSFDAFPAIRLLVTCLDSEKLRFESLLSLFWPPSWNLEGRGGPQRKLWHRFVVETPDLKWSW